ncbi:MAG: hypothetical protein ACJZ59_07810 [Candidatus Thalassarchaeaceae archaeon]
MVNDDDRRWTKVDEDWLQVEIRSLRRTSSRTLTEMNDDNGDGGSEFKVGFQLAFIQ